MKKIILPTIVLFSSFVILAGCNNKTSDNSNKSDATTQKDTTKKSKNQTNKKAVGSLNVAVTLDEAVKIFKEKYPDAAITSISLERELGDYLYEIEGANDKLELSMKIDAKNKRVKDDRSESLDANEQNGVEKKEDGLDLSKIKQPDEINKIALAQIKNGEVSEWQIDKELDITYYEVKVLKQDKRHEVKIDANTGKVLENKLDD